MLIKSLEEYRAYISKTSSQGSQRCDSDSVYFCAGYNGAARAARNQGFVEKLDAPATKRNSECPRKS
jgi:hypothetical protein